MSGDEVPAADRRRLARDLFQRFLVQEFRPGTWFKRPVSSGEQIYSEDDDEGPLGEVMPKLEGDPDRRQSALYRRSARSAGYARGLLRHQHAVRGLLPFRADAS